jgi:hypothetical protein
MANEERVAILRTDVATWNGWWPKVPDEIFDDEAKLCRVLRSGMIVLELLRMARQRQRYVAGGDEPHGGSEILAKIAEDR